MKKITKSMEFELVEKSDNGGRIMITTNAVDRVGDRVLPGGAMLDNYLANPVVQFGHNYAEPWATIGKTTKLEVLEDGIAVEFELRPSANDIDPQNIVRLLWEGDWLRTSSIGFNPLEWEENDLGGRDFTSWELLEWSLVPVPMNQEALRLTAKALDDAPALEKQMQRLADCLDEVFRILNVLLDATAPATKPDTIANDEPDTDETDKGADGEIDLIALLNEL